MSAQNWLKSAPPVADDGVVVAGAVVCVGVAVPPVPDGVVVAAAGGVTAAPPVEDDVGVVEVVEVVDVVVVPVDVDASGVVVTPDGGAVRTGVVLGTL
ncbi:MAG: hypothetical protein JWM73_1936 [Solirubrobacterales bacterium]|nr:hypothetical protein [Solirubrobacterales bacterium]